MKCNPKIDGGKEYLSIVRHYESCLDRYGDTPQGVDWPKEEDVDKRYSVMLDVVPSAAPRPVRLLDFGCGAAHLYERIQRVPQRGIEYCGLDLSERFITLARSKHPEVKFYCMDALDPAAVLPDYDYAVMNGVFTEKREMGFDQMFDYFRRMVTAVFRSAKGGIAFNVMSKQVDWERDDLFHLPLDTFAWFCTRELSRHFVIRNDYGLYEYTAFVYKEPTKPFSAVI
jgi:SAM-dependent methyltransferase